MSLIVAALSKTSRPWHGTHLMPTNTARARVPTRLLTEKQSDPAGRGGKGWVGGSMGLFIRVVLRH